MNKILKLGQYSSCKYQSNYDLQSQQDYLIFLKKKMILLQMIISFI